MARLILLAACRLKNPPGITSAEGTGCSLPRILPAHSNEHRALSLPLLRLEFKIGLAALGRVEQVRVEIIPIYYLPPHFQFAKKKEGGGKPWEPFGIIDIIIFQLAEITAAADLLKRSVAKQIIIISVTIYFARTKLTVGKAQELFWFCTLRLEFAKGVRSTVCTPNRNTSCCLVGFSTLGWET